MEYYNDVEFVGSLANSVGNIGNGDKPRLGYDNIAWEAIKGLFLYGGDAMTLVLKDREQIVSNWQRLEDTIQRCNTIEEIPKKNCDDFLESLHSIRSILKKVIQDNTSPQQQNNLMEQRGAISRIYKILDTSTLLDQEGKILSLRPAKARDLIKQQNNLIALYQKDETYLPYTDEESIDYINTLFKER